ncbi:MAG: MinD/ParA family protein [Hadesarchaea archaeon]|nr:MinD/ParA family protein [Hadesarchaea archaeon]
MTPGMLIAVHSFKGGTGKTLISTNLAATLASWGRNVCLVDFDVRAPSLDAVFPADGKVWVNDYLDGRCEAMDMLKDFSKEKGTRGRLLVALANPSMQAIREVVTKNSKWEMRALHRLLSLKDFLLKKLGIDYIFVDTSPGLSYASINAVAASDLVLVISTWDASDVAGAQGMVGELYGLLEKRAMVLMNKIPEQLIIGDMKARMVEQFKKAFKLPVIDLLPCYCDILRAERSTILALEKPEHPFVVALGEVARRIEEAGKVRRET